MLSGVRISRLRSKNPRTRSTPMELDEFHEEANGSCLERKKERKKRLEKQHVLDKVFMYSLDSLPIVYID